VNTSILFNGELPVTGSDEAPGVSGSISAQVQRGRRWPLLRDILGHLDNAALLLLVVLGIPLAILAVGIPVALAVRLVIELAQR
jgi:hypothetical protein